MPGLFDLAVVVAPDGGLATRQRPDRSLTGAQLADLVRERGGDGFDVRLLVAAGPQTRPTIQAMAHVLDRDVLVAPAGSELGYVPSTSEPNLRSAPRTGRDPGGGVDGNLVPVDLLTGHPVDWLSVQPSGDESPGQSWFELAGGLVLERVGTAALPLPGGGLSLATREDFVRRRSAAATMRPGHPGLVTVAVGLHSGDFVVGDYDGRVSLRDGRQLAASLGPLPLYGRHLRLCLAWPDSIEERRRLGLNLAQLAATTGATVWVPAEGGRVEILGSCRDLSVVHRDARPGRWDKYGDVIGDLLFQSDVDGRLVPVGGVVTTSYPGVPLVSVPAAYQADRLAFYERLRPSQAIFRADFAVLADGRLALRYRDDSLLAAGERQIRQLLEVAGWRGADLVLLSAISPERAVGAWQYAERLGRYLQCGVSLSETPNPRPPAATAEMDQPESDLRALTPQPTPRPVPVAVRAAPPPVPAPPAAVPVTAVVTTVTAASDSKDTVPADIDKPTLPPYPASAVATAFTELDPGEPAQAARLTALATAVADHVANARALAAADSPQRAGLASAQAANTRLIAELAAPSADGPAVVTASRADPFAVTPPVMTSRFIDGPRLRVAPRSPTGHGLTWLPPQPQVNEEQCELYVECAVDPDLTAVDGVPSPGLFLLAHLDAAGLAARTRHRYLLVLRVDPGGAVDVTASEVEPPPALAPSLRHRDVYVLPVGWLDRCRMVAALTVGPGGNLVAQKRYPAVAINLLSRGAVHGVPGLPNEVQRWPRGRLHATATRFVLVRVDNADGLGQWQRLYRQRPPVVPGHWLLEVEVDRERAIDIVGTARALAGLTHVRTLLSQLMTDGTDYIVPIGSYPYVRIEREFVAERGVWRRIRSGASRMLEEWRPEPV